MKEVEMTPEDRTTFQTLMGQDTAANLRVAAAMSLRLDSFNAWQDKKLKDSHDWQLERQALARKEMNEFYTYQDTKYGREPF
jgi:hypothetical protein